MISEYNAKNFDKEVIASKAPVVVDFWASWCGPCKIMGPVMEDLAASYDGADKIKFGKVNVDEAPELAGRFGVMGIPSFLLFKGGKVAAQSTGVQSKEKLKEMIEKFV